MVYKPTNISGGPYPAAMELILRGSTISIDQADFESRSRTPRRGNGHRGSGGNAVPLGRHDPPEPEAMAPLGEFPNHLGD